MHQEQLMPLYIGTGIYGGLFIFLPCFIRKGPYQGVIRCSIYLTIFCMWIFWATVYIAQMNPLVGPRHLNITLIWMRHLEGVKPEVTAAEQPSDADNKDSDESSEDPSRRAGRRRLSHCQEPPDNLFECCNIPWLSGRASAKCIKQPVNVLKLTCEEARCAFREAGWSDRSGLVIMRQLEAYYDNLTRTDRDWVEAVHFIQYAPLPSWSTAAACLASRQYLSTCPLCPVKCNKRIPEDSEAVCRACVMF